MMGKTAIEPRNSRPGTAFEPAPTPAARPQKNVAIWKQILTFVASLRLTVILFVFAAVLVFLGTIAQMDLGIWTVLDKYFRSLVVWIPLQLFVRFAQVFLFVSPQVSVPGAFPFPGGWLIGGLLMTNLLAAHLVRFKVSWKRAGILLIHSGLLAMMLGEFITGTFASEGRMDIDENGSSNLVYDARSCEFAVVDTSDRNAEKQIVIPTSILKRGGVIQNELLPFDVEVLRYMPNSRLRNAKEASDDTPRVTAGDGLVYAAVDVPQVNGLGADTDLPSAYVGVRAKSTEQSLGTYLVSTQLAFRRSAPAQEVSVDGKRFQIALRFKHHYLPYALYLEEFRFDRYPGTQVAKNFSSRVRLVDPDRNEDREILIRMNEPLRHRGETFYQADWDKETEKTTVLQVVRNPGDWLPYISCGLVGIGLLVHFGMKLIEFLRLRAANRVVLTGWPALVPWFAFAAAVLYVAVMMIPDRDSTQGVHLQEFAKIPVLNDGRVMPWDSVARNTLMIISNRQTFRDETSSKKNDQQTPVKWLLDTVVSNPAIVEDGPSIKHKVFRVQNDQLLKFLELEPRPEFWRYSVAELAPKIDKIQKEMERIESVDEKKRNDFDQSMAELGHHLQMYQRLSQWSVPLVIPSPDGQEWVSLISAISDAQESGEIDPATRSFATMIMAYAQNKPDDFNKELAEYKKIVDERVPRQSWMATLEVFYNHFAPFYQCMILYIVVFLLSVCSWVGFGEPLRRAAFGIAILTLTIHSLALFARMYIQGRPPVTNLYSSAIFVGWAAVILGLIIESIFRMGIGSAVAGALGFATTLISHHLAESGDTLAMLQAVLDTNFWLATHVVVVNLGYMATLVAGCIGIGFVITGVLTPWLDRNLMKVLSQITYGSVCFATLLSFVGTVLGGIWADQSWGRFWGWDPKENGALLVVLWNALILHARWGGLVKQRGMAVLAIAGNMFIGWSWFGTNQLGVGLHSYGFNNSLSVGLTIFWISQLVLIGIGLMPTRFWKSFGNPTRSSPADNWVLPAEA
jgi:ABC-type transport system involved in cytochrome c biogenesis permease subunit